MPIFKSFKFLLSATLCTLILSGCSSQSVLPEKEGVKVTREKPDKDCKELGKVTGSAIDVKASREDVLEDMKQNAADKGANYVEVLQYSDNGTAVTGLAYQCP